MDQAEFDGALQRDGFTERVTKSVEPGKVVHDHAHDYDVRALVLDGQMTLEWEGKAETYRAGEVFTMAAGCEHVERIGPEGLRVHAGRRYKS